MKQALKTGWALLWSVPLAAVMVVMILLLLVGWGPKAVDIFLKTWHDGLQEHNGENG